MVDLGLAWQPQQNMVFQPGLMPLPLPADFGLANTVRPTQTYSNVLPAWSQPQMPPPTTFTSPSGYPVQIYTLRNGHRVVIEQRPTDVVSLRTFINTGSVIENPIKKSPYYQASYFPSGISHLDEHCHFLTTVNYPQKNAWSYVVEKLGADYNATTDREVIQHEIACNPKDLPQIIGMHGESVMRPFYRQSDITQEKTNVLNEMSQRTTPPDAKVWNKMQELLFDRPGFQTLGTQEDVKGTTAEQLYRFHQTYYTPTNMVTVLSGKVDPAQVLPLLEKEFGYNPPRVQPGGVPSIQMTLRPGEIRHATVSDPQLNHSIVNIGFPAPAKGSIKERVAMEFFAHLLGTGPLGLFEANVREGRPDLQITSIGCGYQPLKATGEFDVMLETQPGKEREALIAVLQTIQMGAQPQVIQARMGQIKELMIQDFLKAISRTESASGIMGEEILHNSLPFFQNYVNLVQSLSVQDILQTAQKYANPSTYAVVFGVPAQQAPQMPMMPGGPVQ